MAQFDPYHKWLGIPPDEQPPDHYRLLGIRRFEDDPDVIEAAADQRMAHLRTYQAGRHGELSQRLLNEVAAAKLCLLNADKKAACEINLKGPESTADSVSRQTLEQVEPDPAPVPPQPAPVQATPLLPQVTGGVPARHVTERLRRKRMPPVAIVLAVGVLLFGVAGLAFLLSGPSSQDTSSGRASKGSEQRQERNSHPSTEPPVLVTGLGEGSSASSLTEQRDGSGETAPFPPKLPVRTHNGDAGPDDSPEPPATTPKMPPDLILHLTFEPKTFSRHDDKLFAEDASGHGNAGEVIGAVPGEGKRGEGLYFDGQSDSVVLPDFDDIRPLTFSVWLKPEEKHDVDVVLSSRVMGVEGSGIKLHINQFRTGNRMLEFEIPHPRRAEVPYSRRKVHSSGPVVRWGEWQHLALVMRFGPNRVTLFHNGREIAQGNSLVEPVLAPGPWHLGTYMARSSDYHGNMDEVMLFARALSEEEIRRIYELGLQAE